MSSSQKITVPHGWLNQIVYGDVLQKLYDKYKDKLHPSKPWNIDISKITADEILRTIQETVAWDNVGSDEQRESFTDADKRELVNLHFNPTIFERALIKKVLAWSIVDVGKLTTIKECLDKDGKVAADLVSDLGGNSKVKVGKEDGPLPGMSYVVGEVISRSTGCCCIYGQKVKSASFKFRSKGGEPVEDGPYYDIVLKAIIQEPVVPEKCGAFKSAFNWLQIPIPKKVTGRRTIGMDSGGAFADDLDL